MGSSAASFAGLAISNRVCTVPSRMLNATRVGRAATDPGDDAELTVEHLETGLGTRRRLHREPDQQPGHIVAAMDRPSRSRGRAAAVADEHHVGGENRQEAVEVGGLAGDEEPTDDFSLQ